jgi:hypothetical protein
MDQMDPILDEVAPEAARSILSAEAEPSSVNWGSGAGMIESLRGGGGPNAFNTIPTGRPGPDCLRLVVVAIGSRDNVSERVLQAFEKLGGHCRGKTTHVVFWARKWQSEVWESNERDFRSIPNAVVVLKIPNVPAAHLR